MLSRILASGYDYAGSNSNDTILCVLKKGYDMEDSFDRRI